MSARLAALASLAFAGLLLLAAPARAQEGPAPAPPPTVVVVVPGQPGGVAQGPVAPPPYPYPYPYYDPQAPLPPPPPPQRTSQFSAKLWAGPQYQRLFDVDLYTAVFGVSLGAQRGISGWYGEMQGNFGSTVHGLSTYEYWAGASWEGKIDRVHLGLGLHLGLVAIKRATDGTSMSDVGVGGFAFASVDLYQAEGGHALYLGARMNCDTVANTSLFGPSASLGWRY